jgi:microcin C transport system permease protein
MTSYFLRRFLLIIPTFVGITMLVFAILQFCPGNIVDHEIDLLQSGGTLGEAGSGVHTLGGVKNIEKIRKEREHYYGFDRPILVQYGDWFSKLIGMPIQFEKRPLSHKFLFIENLWYPAKISLAYPDMGFSYMKKSLVFDRIVSRLPVSIKVGLIGFVLSYLVCIPLGVMKGVRHGSSFDFSSSLLIFIAYSIPGWTLGIVLLVWLGGDLGIVPLGGLYSDNYAQLSAWGKFLDQLHHGILPIFCYMLGNFATLTILMKNSLMENLSADYIRTAFAKGLSERRVIFLHCLRNSLIPIATGLGHAFSIIIAGSYLIEKVFNINGFGLLGFNAIADRDYPVALGILVIASILRLVGNIFSDMLYCLFDPRIRFQ